MHLLEFAQPAAAHPRLVSHRTLGWSERLHCIRSACEGDRTSDKFKADLDKCRTVSTEAVRLKNAATPQSWVISPITGPPAVRAAILKCMEEKGYAQENATG